MHPLQHRSLHHVLLRGAMAVGLLALGVGGGFGFQETPTQSDATSAACSANATLPERAVIDDRPLAVNLAITRSLRKRG